MKLLMRLLCSFSFTRFVLHDRKQVVFVFRGRREVLYRNLFASRSRYLITWEVMNRPTIYIRKCTSMEKPLDPYLSVRSLYNGMRFASITRLFLKTNGLEFIFVSICSMILLFIEQKIPIQWFFHKAKKVKSISSKCISLFWLVLMCWP